MSHPTVISPHITHEVAMGRLRGPGSTFRRLTNSRCSQAELRWLSCTFERTAACDLQTVLRDHLGSEPVSASRAHAAGWAHYPTFSLSLLYPLPTSLHTDWDRG